MNKTKKSPDKDKQEKQQVEPEVVSANPKKTFSLKLTRQELLHLRDLFSILLPPDMKLSVSQALASSQGRHLVETKLWNKVANLCSEASIPTGDDASDFVITICAPPTLGVFEMMTDDDSDDQTITNMGSMLEKDEL